MEIVVFAAVSQVLEEGRWMMAMLFASYSNLPSLHLGERLTVKRGSNTLLETLLTPGAASLGAHLILQRYKVRYARDIAEASNSKVQMVMSFALKDFHQISWRK